MAAEKPEILYVTTALIAAPYAGCMLRTLHICRQLAAYGRVTMLAVSHRFDAASVQTCRNEFSDFHLVKLKPYDALSRPFGEIKRKWDMHWPFSHGLQADAAGRRLFAELARKSDLVWFHTLGAAHPFGHEPLPLSVMDVDDLNQCKYDLRQRHDANFRYRCSAAVQAYKWKKHESDALKTYDIVAVCSEQDKQYLSTPNVRVVPNGFAAPAQTPAWTKPDPLRLGFIGSLGYGPNYDGLVWFRDKVWPYILHQRPRMELRLVGAPPLPKYHVAAQGFTYLGYVQDPADEIRTWSAMIVPIPYGGGTRIKILEAFSRLCPVVATPAGAYGLRVADQKDILLAAEPELFAQHCLELSHNPAKGKSLAEAGWRLFTQHYTWERIGESIGQIVEELTNKRSKADAGR